jgi:PKHD-type hydroxylase
MQLIVRKLLSKEEVSQVRSRMDAAPFIEGASRVAGAAASVKNNQQIREDSDIYKELVPYLMRKIAGNSQVTNNFFPKTILPLLLSRYEVGRFYGPHMDAPFFRNGDLRADVSMTLFLSEPEEYGGGELTLMPGGEEVMIKLAAGDAFFYPTTVLHRVAEVTSGVRVVAVTWMESFIRNPQYREIAAQLNRVQGALAIRPDLSEEADILRAASSNLLRDWWGR